MTLAIFALVQTPCFYLCLFLSNFIAKSAALTLYVCCDVERVSWHYCALRIFNLNAHELTLLCTTYTHSDMASKQCREQEQEEDDDDDDGPPELVALPLPSSSFSPNKLPLSALPAQAQEDDGAIQQLSSSSMGSSTAIGISKIIPVTIISGFLGAGTCLPASALPRHNSSSTSPRPAHTNREDDLAQLHPDPTPREANRRN